MALEKEGLVPDMDCPFDQGLLFANTDTLDGEDRVFIYCLSCDYKKYIGIHLYKKMEGYVNANQ